MTDRLDNITKIGIGAALAFWFAYYVLGSERSHGAALVMSAVWMAAVFLKLWLQKKANND